MLMLLLFGMIWTGLAYSDHLSVTNAVREGARFGSGLDYTTSGWADTVRDRVKQVYLNAGSTLSDSQVCVKIVNSSLGTPSGASSSLGSACSGSPPDLSGFSMTSGSCAVVVWVKKPATIHLFVAPDLHFYLGSKSISYYGLTVSTCTAK